MTGPQRPGAPRPGRAEREGGPMPEHSPHRVVVVGAGFGGLGMALALKQAGIGDFLVLDRAADLGGTWRDNTYPGLACDVPSVQRLGGCGQPHVGVGERVPQLVHHGVGAQHQQLARPHFPLPVPRPPLRPRQLPGHAGTAGRGRCRMTSVRAGRAGQRRGGQPRPGDLRVPPAATMATRAAASGPAPGLAARIRAQQRRRLSPSGACHKAAGAARGPPARSPGCRHHRRRRPGGPPARGGPVVRSRTSAPGRRAAGARPRCA